MTLHLALVGPTASGKSQLALDVARHLGDVEIVSLDSMQVYRGMDIGTAKPTAAQRAEVPHHLLDIADPSEDWSAVRTQRAAATAIAGIEARGRRALLVGGTGLYVQAVVDGLEFPAEDLSVRAELEARTEDPDGLGAAYAELTRADPTAAERIEPQNRRRIVRALEVIQITGRPFSSFGPGLNGFGPPALAVTMVGVWTARPVLSARINARVEAMRAGGLAQEVAALAEGPWSRTAGQAIGYRELGEHLAGGPDAPTLDDAFSTTIRRTRSFARRQRMWFRRDRRITWLAAGENPEALTPAVLAIWSH